jgi:hypothetical protein
MKKYLVIFAIAAMIIACSIFGAKTSQLEVAPQASPNVLVDNAINVAQQTQAALSLTQAAMVKQQQDIAAAQTQAAQGGANPPQQGQAGDAALTQAAAVERTATMVAVLTQAAITQTALVMQNAPQYRGKGSAGTDFAGIVIYAWGHWEKNVYELTFQLLNPVGSEKFHMEMGGQTFKCVLTNQYPNRLYCTGPVLRGGPYEVEIYEDIASGKELVYRDTYTLPAWTATPIPTPTKNKTPKS